MIISFLYLILSYGNLELLWTSHLSNGNEVQTYIQNIDGIPVEGSLVKKIVHPSRGTIFENHREITSNIENKVILTRNEAKNLINAEFPSETSEPALVVYAGEELDLPPLFVWKVTWFNGDINSQEIKSYYISASDGQIVNVKDEIVNESIYGNVQGYASPGQLPDIPSNPPELLAIPNIQISSHDTSVFANRFGDFTIDNIGEPVDLTVIPVSRWANVIDASGQSISETRTAAPGDFVQFELNNRLKEQFTAELNVLIHVFLMRDFFVSRTSWDGLNFQIVANVNINQSCNAFFSGASINFYAKSDLCVNTAYSSVIAHEYGHFIVSRLGLQQRSFGEGFADTCSMLLYNDPIVGRNFYLDGNYVRYPSEAGVPCGCLLNDHYCGQALSGVWWQLREEFGDRYGDEIGLEYARQLFVDWAMMTLGGLNNNALHRCIGTEILLVDDDDGDIRNGTPNFDIIQEVLDRHKVRCLPINLCSVGDMDGNRRVDIQDLFLFLQVFGTNQKLGDFNEDGRIDIEDLSLLLMAYNTPC